MRKQRPAVVFLSLLLLGAVFAVIAAGTIVRAVETSLVASVLEEQTRAASAGADAVAERMAGLRAQLDASARSLLTQYAAARKDRAVLTSILIEMAPLIGIDRDVQKVLFLDQSGLVVATQPPDPGLIDTSLADRPEVVAALRDGLAATGRVEPSQLRGGPPAVALVAPVRDGFGRPAGAIIAMVDLQQAASWVAPARAAATETYLFDDEGRLIVPLARRGEAQLMSYRTHPVVAAALAGSAPRGSLADPRDGRSEYGATSLVRDLSWQVLAVRDADTITGMTGFLGGLLLATFGVLALLFATGGAAFASVFATSRARAVSIEDLSRSLARAEKVGSDLLSHMSHDLRTPLGSVLGFARLLQEKSAAKLSDGERRWVTNIVSAGDDLMRLLTEVLDYARVESSRLDLHRVPVSISDLLAEQIAAGRGLGEARDVAFVAAALPDESVLVDPARTRAIMQTLLLNAFAATPPGGTVRLGVSPNGDNAVGVEVTDGGPGIPRERWEKVFAAFEPVGERGAGVGLALAKRLAELQGGALTFSTDELSGTTFVLRLQVAGPVAG